MNIFNILEKYKVLISLIEEAEGEITEEVANKLKITEEDFSEKLDNYAYIIAQLEGNNAVIKDEIGRLNKLQTINSNIIQRLKETINTGLKLFGTVGKTGNQKFKTELHNFYNVYHKPLVIEENNKITNNFIKYQLSTKLNHEEMELISDELIDIDKDLTFTEEIDKVKLKNYIADGNKIEGVKIDTSASYLVIK